MTNFGWSFADINMDLFLFHLGMNKDIFRHWKFSPTGAVQKFNLCIFSHKPPRELQLMSPNFTPFFNKTLQLEVCVEILKEIGFQFHLYESLYKFHVLNRDFLKRFLFAFTFYMYIICTIIYRYKKAYVEYTYTYAFNAFQAIIAYRQYCNQIILCAPINKR